MAYDKAPAQKKTPAAKKAQPANKAPKVSVLMPFYDDGTDACRNLAQDAVSSILAQTFTDFEILLVVSGKEDFAKKLASLSPKIRMFYFQQEAIAKDRPLAQRIAGIVKARNMCIDNARGEYSAFADYDDISMPERLETEAGFLDANPDIGAVGSFMLLIDAQGKESGLRTAPQTDLQIRSHFLQFNPMPAPSAMVRTELIREAGGYTLGEFSEDYDLWVRLAAITKFQNLPQPLVKYRVHSGGGASKYKFDLYFSSLRVKRKAAKLLGLHPGPADVAVNALQLASLFVPDGLRRTVLERMRGKYIVSKQK